MSFDEGQQWETCGVSYFATRQQANDAYVKIMATPEFVDYAIAKDRVQHGTFDATSKAGQDLVTLLVTSYRKAYVKALEIIRREIGPDAA
jgi:hypothetical protein